MSDNSFENKYNNFLNIIEYVNHEYEFESGNKDCLSNTTALIIDIIDKYNKQSNVSFYSDFDIDKLLYFCGVNKIIYNSELLSPRFKKIDIDKFNLEMSQYEYPLWSSMAGGEKSDFIIECEKLKCLLYYIFKYNQYLLIENDQYFYPFNEPFVDESIKIIELTKDKKVEKYRNMNITDKTKALNILKNINDPEEFNSTKVEKDFVSEAEKKEKAPVKTLGSKPSKDRK